MARIPWSGIGRGHISRLTQQPAAVYFAEQALEEIRAGRTKTWEKFEVPNEGIGCGFTEAVRGVL